MPNLIDLLLLVPQQDTDGNLTLLCSYHHHNFASRGWTCRMIDGLPAWLPPRWVDPARRPLRNARITARQQGLVLTC